MASSQPLVPTGEAYGDRQENVALMQQAGIPLAPSAPRPTAPTPAGPGPASPAGQGQPPLTTGGEFNPLDLLAANSPDAFPFLGAPGVEQPSSEPDSPLAALAASAQSSFGLAVLTRLRQSR